MLDFQTLKVIWWLLLGILLIGFAIMDGFDLGVGMLLPFIARSDTERRVVINTVGPVWEGNQVWFILGGGAIFAAWPALYAASFSGFYLAMMLVLAALILRPVGFKFRSKMPGVRWRANWDWALFVGGAVPALVFGVAMGNLLEGVPFSFDSELRATYAFGLFDLLNPFALLCGLVSVAMLVDARRGLSGGEDRRRSGAARPNDFAFCRPRLGPAVFARRASGCGWATSASPSRRARCPAANPIRSPRPRLPAAAPGSPITFAWPATLLVPRRSVSLRPLLVAALAGSRRRLTVFLRQQSRHRRGHRHDGSKPVPVPAALLVESAKQPYGVGCLEQSTDAWHHAGCRYYFSADRARLYRLGLSRHARAGDQRLHRSQSRDQLLRSDHVVFQLDIGLRPSLRFRDPERHVVRIGCRSACRRPGHRHGQHLVTIGIGSTLNPA